MTTKNTATLHLPLQVKEITLAGENKALFAIQDNVGAWLCELTSYDTAAFIVQAVNSHEELINAVEWALNQLQDGDEVTKHECIIKLQQALANVGGK